MAPINDSCWPCRVQKCKYYTSATSIIFVATKVLSPKNASFVMTKVCLLQQTCVYWVKYLSWQKFYHNNFVTTKVLSQQAYFCHDKTRVCCNKHMLVMTKLLSRQKLHLWQVPPMIKASNQETTVRFSQIIIIWASSIWQTILWTWNLVQWEQNKVLYCSP